MNRKLKSLIIIFLLLILYGVYYWGIPAVIDMPKKSGVIEYQIKQKLGYKTAIKNPSLKMGLIPAIAVKADNFEILNDDNTVALKIENPNIKISLFPLLFKKLDIKHFSASSINANLVFDKDSKLKLGQYNIDKQINLPLKISKARVRVNSYNVNLDDRLQSKKIKLVGKYLAVGDYIEGKRITLYTIADLFVGEKASFIKADIDMKLPINRLSDDQLKISGHIVNLNLADFSTYAKYLSKDKIKSLSGIIDFSANTIETEDNHKQIITQLFIKNLGILKEDKASSIYFQDKLDIKADVKTIRNGIEINEMKIKGKGKGLDAFLNGTVSKLNTKSPFLNLNVTINPSKIEHILPIIPGEEKTVSEIDIHLLKETGFWGDITGNIEIKGKADTPGVFGNILVTNGYLLKPVPGDTPKATIKMAFKGEKMDLDVEVPISKTQAVFVKGPVELYKDRSADLWITSTDSADLKTVQNILNPLHRIIGFLLGPVPIMDLHGVGNINLHVIGTRKDPHGWGSFNVNDTTASFLDIHNMILKNVTATLKFDDQNTHFYTKSATLNGKPVIVDGKCTMLGLMDFDIKTNGQDLNDLLKIIKTSPMLADIQNLLEPIQSASGPANFSVKLTGDIIDIMDVAFNKNIFAKGSIELLGNDIKPKDFPVTLAKTTGKINFNNLDADFNLISNFDKSKIFAEGKIKDSNINTKITTNSFNVGDALKLIPQSSKLPFKEDLARLNTSFAAKYNGKMDDINYNNISVKGKIYSNRSNKTMLVLDNGEYELNNSTFKLAPLNGSLKGSPFVVSANISKVFDKNISTDGAFRMQKFDLSVLNDEKIKDLLPADIAKHLNDCRNIEGVIDLNAKIKNNSLNASTVLNNISMIYVPKRVKLSISSGNLYARGDTIHLNKVNAQVGEMPVLLDGKISNIFKKPSLFVYLNAKPTQEFLDQFFNNKAVYPIKLKGDVNVTSRISGTKENINANTVLKVEENSRIYYMGSTIGDTQYPVRITIDNNISGNRVRINNLQYDKIISSQNNKPNVNPQLNASGSITLLPDNNVEFHNFKFKTQTPTDAKIFNIIFRKPIMKQGVFSSDLILNGTNIAPKIRGTMEITSIDMPFFDSTINDINLDFKQDYIHVTSKGVVLTNDIKFYTIMKNKLTPPYIIESVKIELADLDINKITDSLRDYEAEAHRKRTSSTTSSQQFDLSHLIINKAEVVADKIKVKNINATDFSALLSLNEKMVISVDKFKFNIAEGFVNGSSKYNLLNNAASLNLHLNNANSDMMTEALFDLKGQIYGSMTGDIKLVCNGKSNDKCFETLSGEGNFRVANGKMPKLGSLEYLLKAGNLLKGGIAGLSINSLIDFVTPLKTGNFESISGDVSISDGVAKKINIYSKGKDLNMYMTGTYNFTNAIADMKIFGSLSKDITSVLGKVRNASINTLLNTIPGINDPNEELILQEGVSKIPNLSNQSNIFRLFTVDIYGDINGDNYVQSFKWVK